MFQSCLICTKLSDGLDRLADFVPSLAKGGIKQIIFLHCLPLWKGGNIPLEEEKRVKFARESFSSAFKNLPLGAEVKVEVVFGSPLEVIPRLLETYPVEVIILGNRLDSSWEEKFFGSTVMGLAKLTSIPLMIIRPQLMTIFTEEELDLRCQHLWRYLMIPYNDSPDAQYLITRIKDSVKKRPERAPSRCLLVSVIDDSSREEIVAANRLEQAREKLEQVGAELEALNLQVDRSIRKGNPLQQIAEVALSNNVSTIALASRDHHSLFDALLPRFANQLLHLSWIPILWFADGQH